MPFAPDLLIGGAGIATTLIASLAWRNRPRTGSLTLATFMATISVWSWAHLVSHHLGGTAHLLTEKLQWTALAPAAFLWFAFVLAFTGRRDRLERWWPLLFAPPVVVVLLTWVPADSGLPLAIWESIEAEEGLAFWSHALLSYGVLAVGSVLLGQEIVSSSVTFRRQALVILVGTAVLWVSSIVALFELFGSMHFHALPLGFAVLGGFMLWGIVGTGLTDIAPIAHRTVVRNLSAGVLTVDADGVVTDCNPEARSFLGAEGRTVVGKPVDGAFPDEDELVALVERSLSARQPAETSLGVDGRVLEAECSPLTAKPERLLGGVVLLYDVTAQEARQERLAERNDQLEQLRSTISHDLRSPLSVASGNVELARDGLDSDHDDHLETASEALEHMESLIEDLQSLTLADQPVEETERVSLGQVADKCWSMVDTEGATLQIDGDERFEADPHRLQQVFENLFRNAVEHGGAGVTVTVGTLDGNPTAGFYVADDGRGIPPAERETVLESGYSSADGTGLGLAIVDGIVGAHDWAISVTESADGGARFEITGVDVTPATDE